MSDNQLNTFTDKEIKEARARLWEMGILEWKFSVTQKKIYEFINASSDRNLVVNCSRRLGKSYYLTVIAIQQCLRKPNSIVKMIQPEVKMIRTNIRPIIKKILEDCPDSLRPDFKTQDNIYVFKNGSEIQLAGTDNGNHEKLRGGDSDLCIIDEAGFCSELDYIVKSVLGPTTFLTKGKIVISSTTPPNPDHEFVKYMQQAEIENRVIRKTIFDALEDDRGTANPRITEEIIADEVKKHVGGVDSESFRTEFLCQVIYNSKDSVVPEFTDLIQQDTVVNWPKPVFYDRYTAMDIGYEDLTFLVFGYWDFDNGVLVIEDEFHINGPEMTTPTLAKHIKAKEEALWTNRLTGEFEKPLIRVADNNLILINDLQKDHGLTFFATDKHNKDAYLGEMRKMIASRQIIIHPRCKTLISHLKSATWNKARSDFKRSPDNGHYDGVAALMYLCRNLDKARNPYPRGYRYSKLGTPGQIFINPNAQDEQNPQYTKLAKMFERKSSFKLKK